MYPVINMRNQKLIEQFLRNSVYSKTTIRSYRWHLHRWGNYLRLLGKDFEEVTPELALAYLDTQEWGASIRAQSLQALRAVISYHYGKDHAIYELPVKKPKPTPQKTLTEKELAKMIRTIDMSEPQGVRNLAIIAIMMDTGIRNAETCRLDLRHISMDDRTFNVIVKGGDNATKIFSEIASDCLSAWLAIRSAHAAPGVHNVFVSIGGLTPGNRLTSSGLRMLYRVMGNHAGIDGMSPHVMRRTFATLTTIYGAPSEVLRRAGGWKDPRTMARYTQAVPDRTIESYFPSKRLLGGEKKEVDPWGSQLDSNVDIAGFFFND